MIDLKEGKEVYNRIKIPDELSERVNSAISSVDRKKVHKRNQNLQLVKTIKVTGCLAASFLVCVTVALNTNYAFAQSMSEIPVFGRIAKVLTLRSYSEESFNTTVTVEVPTVAVDIPSSVSETSDTNAKSDDSTSTTAEGTPSDFIVDINAEINAIVDTYVADAKTRMEEYNQAFLDTGGTEEELAEREINIDVTYEVKYQQGSVLSLVLTTTESWASVYGENVYYNLDLEHDKKITLKDLLGENYISIANESIISQINQRLEEDDTESLVYWGYGSAAEDDVLIEGFTTIDENTSFYLNESGNPVICFPKYEISPGFMGIQEFEIQL